jgi:hypothetical protein
MQLRNADLSSMSITVGDTLLASSQPDAHRNGKACRATVPLQDVAGRTIGMVDMQLTSDSSCAKRAESLRDQLRQWIASAASLSEPFLSASSPAEVLAQKLTLETLSRHPELLVLAFHATAPGDAVNRVIAINVAKFLGRPSDDVDQDVSRTGKMIVQVIPATHRMETHMPLRDARGSLIGALVTVYLWDKEAEAPEFIHRSMEIRDELQSHIPSLTALLRPETILAR